MRQVSSTECRVAILAPNGTEFFLGSRTTGERPPWFGGLLAAEAEKDLHQAVGGFTLTLDALTDTEGRTWEQRIPMRSLVLIAMDRPGMTEVRDATVMIGLTDTHAIQESFSEAQPRRLVQVHGRELGCVIVDAHLLFHPLLAANPAYGTLTIASAAKGTFEVALTANPLHVTPGEPRAILRDLLNHFLFAGGKASTVERVAGAIGEAATPPEPPAATEGMPVLQAPLIDLDLPGARLEDLLDPNYHAWRTFEEPVAVPIAQFPARVGSLWNYLHLFVDRHFQEFFTRIEDGVCRIHFRGKPFRHGAMRSGTRFKSSEEEPTLQTLALDPADILARSLQRESGNVYNFFLVLPYGFSDSHTVANYRYQILPQVVTDPTHPSFVGRYGLRVLEVQSRYLSPFKAGAVAGPLASGVAPLQPPSVWEATYAPLANQLAAEERLPAHLRPWFVANIKVESNFNPTAVSHAGAKGIAQFIPETAAAMGLTNPFDPVASLRASAQYWNHLRTFPWIGDDPYLLAAAYNAGPGAVQTHRGIPPFPETQTHVRRVEAAMPRYAALAGTTPPVVAPSPPSSAVSKGDEDTMIASAQRWGAILKNWHDMGGELFGGTLTVRGDPRWNVGHRLVSRDTRGDWEAYIEGVRHRYDVRTGQYLTTLRVTRGWYLASEIAAQMRQEGQTTVTAVSGGPPAIEAEPSLAPYELEATITTVVIGGQTYAVIGDELKPVKPPGVPRSE
jgi:hypothetical protein